MREGNRLWDYEVLSELGKGEYGIVFKVRSRKDGKLCALKKVNISNSHVHLAPARRKKKYKPLERLRPLN